MEAAWSSFHFYNANNVLQHNEELEALEELPKNNRLVFQKADKGISAVAVDMSIIWIYF